MHPTRARGTMDDLVRRTSSEVEQPAGMGQEDVQIETYVAET